jgi:hypothetical protein
MERGTELAWKTLRSNPSARPAVRRGRRSPFTFPLNGHSFFFLAVSYAQLYAFNPKAVPHIQQILPFKSPFEYNLPPNELGFARSVTRNLDNRLLLGPDSTNWPIALVNPSVRFEVPRRNYVQHAFANLGKLGEGNRRLLAQRLVESCERTPETLSAFLECINNGVDAIIVRDCPENPTFDFERVLENLPGSWIQGTHQLGYALYLKTQASLDSVDRH